MTIYELLDVINADKSGFANTECGGVFADSRKVLKNSIFVCIKGLTSDGHSFAKMANDKGAAVIVCDHDLGIKNQVIVDDTRAAYASLCAALFGFPARELHIIGITGTSGKTTTSYMVKSMLEQAGHKVGVIGTIQNIIGDKILPSHYTTPDPYELHSMFRLMVSAGCDWCVMEVSSMALDQGRVYGIHYDTAVFTNLSQDHLDYHKTMDNYLFAKLKLFEMCDNAVINIDDERAKEVIAHAEKNSCKIYTYSAKGGDADFVATDISYAADKVEYTLKNGDESAKISVKVPGVFMVYNSMCAGVVANSIGMDFGVISNNLSNVRGVKGVVEVVPCERDFTLIIDFAHTPEELKNVLDMLSKFKKGRLVTLFGCGGDRDATKRPKMAAAVTNRSDFTIITSDNPRSEDPMKIIDDILPGVKDGAEYSVIPDRREAIKFAVKNAQKDDIILFAGKGYETYQILGTGTVHFDEREVIAEALAE